jgi:hypothetical protein
VAGRSDGSPSSGLGHFDLHVGHPLEGEQGRTGFGGDAIALSLGKTWQGQAKDGPIAHQSGGLDPAQLDQAAPAASILDGVEGGLGLLH